MNILPGAERPLIFAHRGYSSIAPENTLASFSEALNRGVPGVELDIHLAAGGELVVTHDDNLKRVTGLDKKVENTDLAEIKKLDAGGWKDAGYSGERIPLLEEVFDLLGDKVYYDIEIKSRMRSESGIEKKLYELIKQYKLNERCIVSSFNPLPLKYFKNYSKEVPTAIIYCNDDELPWYLRLGEGKWIGNTDILKPEHVKVNSLSMFFNKSIGGRPVLPWTVDDPEIVKKLISKGVDGIISNDPSVSCASVTAAR